VVRNGGFATVVVHGSCETLRSLDFFFCCLEYMRILHGHELQSPRRALSSTYSMYPVVFDIRIMLWFWSLSRFNIDKSGLPRFLRKEHFR
jgi:hypothetical protein